MDPRKQKPTTDERKPRKDGKTHKPLSLDDLPIFDPSREQASTRPTETGDFVEDIHIDGQLDD